MYWINYAAITKTKMRLQSQSEIYRVFLEAGDTRCIVLSTGRHLGQSLDYAYAHHISATYGDKANFLFITEFSQNKSMNGLWGILIDCVGMGRVANNSSALSQFADGCWNCLTYACQWHYMHKNETNYCGSCHL